jgi:hypothetical protein
MIALVLLAALLTADLPTPSVTPGAVFPVTVAQICQPGYSKTVRNVPQSVKNAVFKRYGIKTRTPGAYEIDHLISLELGGSNDIKNLWPQLYAGTWNAHMKDKLENQLHGEVCIGNMNLVQAQRAISKDWIAAYQQMQRDFGHPREPLP